MIIDQFAGERVNGHRPWPRVIVGAGEWRHASEALRAGTWTLMSLWGDARAVHMAVLDETIADIAVLTFQCQDEKFPSVGALHPPAIRLERAIHDLFGLMPVGALDERSWLDLGFWGIEAPLGAAGAATTPRAP